MNTPDDNNETEDFRARGAVQLMFRGSTDPRVRLVIAVFVLGSAAHLWLADAAQPGWMPANMLYVLGLVILVVSGGPIGWSLCAAGLAIPLLFLRDQLTQSAFLLAVSVAGVGFTGQDAPRARVDSFLVTLRALTLITYGVAGFHKLNDQFLDAAYSCANYGIDEVVTYWNLDRGWIAPDAGFWPFVALASELSVPALYLARRRHAARIAALVFHIPLTMTMAPAFAFVMAAGHAAFVTDDERRILWAGLRRHAVPLVAFGALVTGLSLGLHGAWPEPLMIPREFLLWLALGWFVVVRPDRTTFGLEPRGAARFVIIGAFALNVLSPYAGLQYQHAGAMLSNLRIDRGCWNHALLPEAVRITDDYVRAEAAWFGEPGRLPEYEQIVREQLWSPPQMLQMRRNWCKPALRPFYMRGTYRGAPFVIEDICDTREPWPFQPLFPDYLRFQKNLLRTCPQTCIH